MATTALTTLCCHSPSPSSRPSFQFSRLLARPRGISHLCRRTRLSVAACVPSPSPSSSNPFAPSESVSQPSVLRSTTPASTRLYVSGLSFRTTQQSLINAFENFGQLVEVNLIMDRVANRPRGFAFLRYATEDEAKKAIEGMHGKFLDGRVIFVEVARPRSETRQGPKETPRRF